MADVFKRKSSTGEALSIYYGKLKVVPGTWKRVSLYTDKESSRRRLRELQTEADQRRAGILTPDTDRLALPITTLAEQYGESLRTQGRDGDHLRIVKWMNEQLIELGGWKFYRDITRDSMGKILATLEGRGATASYRNKYLAR